MQNSQDEIQKRPEGCRDCGALVQADGLRTGYDLRCPRCKSVLVSTKSNSINRTIALSLSGLLIFIPACFLPILKLNIWGITGDCTMFKGVVQMFGNGFWWMSFLVLFSSVIAPLAVFLLLFFITVSAQTGQFQSLVKKALKFYHYIHEWTMLDVYMLAILIAYIKMKDYGDVSVETGFYCFSGVLFFAVLTMLNFDSRIIWEKIDKTGGNSATKSPDGEKAVLCGICSRVCFENEINESGKMRCLRCNSKLHFRKPNDITRTWAFVITGFLLLIPANLCPITYIVYYGFGEPDTILSGIGCLIRDGLIPIAILVFIASIIVPLVKLFGLTYLLMAVFFKWKLNTFQCTVMYRFISAIGRWSMLDLFMLSILVAMVEMGAVSSIVPGTGATAFASVVVITMLAAMNFDPRRLWDLEEHSE